MKDYGTQRSAVMPEEMEVTSEKVFIATNIHQVTITNENESYQEYEFNLVEYDKDEYIKLQNEKNTALEKQVTDTQVALTEVYEMILV